MNFLMRSAGSVSGGGGGGRHVAALAVRVGRAHVHRAVAIAGPRLPLLARVPPLHMHMPRSLGATLTTTTTAPTTAPPAAPPATTATATAADEADDMKAAFLKTAMAELQVIAKALGQPGLNAQQQALLIAQQEQCLSLAAFSELMTLTHELRMLTSKLERMTGSVSHELRMLTLELESMKDSVTHEQRMMTLELESMKRAL